MSNLISILQHTGSQEGSQNVSYWSTSTPQAKHKAPARTQQQVHLLKNSENMQEFIKKKEKKKHLKNLKLGFLTSGIEKA